MEAIEREGKRSSRKDCGTRKRSLTEQGRYDIITLRRLKRVRGLETERIALKPSKGSRSRLDTNATKSYLQGLAKQVRHKCDEVVFARAREAG